MSDATTGRPNFILFITDQHRADFLGCYGHPVVRTPHIDSIAAAGTVFDRFHVNSPVCMPNRASLMTGRLPAVHGVRSNGVPLALEAATFVDLLREAGYATALVGKSHLQNFTSNPALLRPVPVPEGYRAPSQRLRTARREDRTGALYRQEQPDYWQQDDAHVETPFYGFEHVELVIGHGDDVGGDYVRWLRARDPAALGLLGPQNSLPHDYLCPQAFRTRIPEELYATAYIGERAEAYLQAHAKDAAPFFLMVSFPDPHHPFNPPGKYWDMYKPHDFPVPEAYARNDWTPPPHVQRAIDAAAKGTDNRSGMGTIAVSAREAQEARALTAGMIACVDDAIGRVLAALARSGARDDTVVMFTSDHGDHLGDHRLLLKGGEHYQSIVHVPFIWSDPRAPQPARTQALGATADIGATVLDCARVAPYVGMQGRSLLPAMGPRGAPVRDAVLIQYEQQTADADFSSALRVYSLVHERWRMSVFLGRPWGELYDLEADPGEFDNLWDQPAHAAVRARMMERLAYALIEHNDRLPLATGRA